MGGGEGGDMPNYWFLEALLGGGRGVSHVPRLNFKTSCVGVYKYLSLIVGFAVTVAIWPREVGSCHDFILCTVTTFWAMLLVGIYPGRSSCWAPSVVTEVQITYNKRNNVTKQ